MHVVLVGQVFNEWANNWLMPVWLLGLGALLALALLLVLWGLAFVIGAIPGLQKTVGTGAREATRIVGEGPLTPIFVLTVVMATFGVAGFFLVRAPADIVSSLTRIPQMGETSFKSEVISTPRDALGEADGAQESKFSVDFRRRELESLQIQATENVLVYTVPFEEGARRSDFDVAANIPFTWNRNRQNYKTFPDEQVQQVYVVNRGSKPATVTMVVNTRPANPEVIHVLITAVCVVSVVLIYFLQSLFMPRMSAVALATYKSEVAQPLFLILIGLGFALLFIFTILPTHTLGEDIKMLKDNGLTLIMLMAMLQAVWAAGTSISEEVEGRTALTVLSKPITRRSFIAGKYVGILWTVLVLFTVLGLWFLVMVSYKPIYDAKENSIQIADVNEEITGQSVTWEVCHKEMADTVPGLALSFMETAVMASLAVAISTRLPLLANMVICLSIYVLGHLTPVLVDSTTASEQFEPVIFAAQLIATIFPNLESFNVSPSVAGGVSVPWIYLRAALVYSLVYSMIAMLLCCSYLRTGIWRKPEGP